MCEMEVIQIPAGKFLYGDEKVEKYLPEYYIGKYPVTNGEYLKFVEDTGREWKSPKGMNPGFARHPATHVSWHDAVAYCEWLSEKIGQEFRLPTEQEWEKATRGTDGRIYPWGEWAEGRCNTRESGIGDTTPVGKYSPVGDSPYGCVDVAGNVWEWTGSLYDIAEGCYVLRGGSWYDDEWDACCACRFWGVPDFFDHSVGFRLVVSLGSQLSDFYCPSCGIELSVVKRWYTDCMRGVR